MGTERSQPQEKVTSQEFTRSGTSGPAKDADRCTIRENSCWKGGQGQTVCLERNSKGRVEVVVRNENGLAARASQRESQFCGNQSKDVERLCGAKSIDTASGRALGCLKAAREMCQGRDALLSIKDHVPANCKGSQIFDKSTGQRYDHYYHCTSFCEAQRQGEGAGIGAWGVGLGKEAIDTGSTAKDVGALMMSGQFGKAYNKAVESTVDSASDMGANWHGWRGSERQPGTRCSDICARYTPKLFRPASTFD